MFKRIIIASFVFTISFTLSPMSHSNEFPGSKFFREEGEVAQPFSDLLNMTSLAQEVSLPGFSFIVDKRQNSNNVMIFNWGTFNDSQPLEKVIARSKYLINLFGNPNNINVLIPIRKPMRSGEKTCSFEGKGPIPCDEYRKNIEALEATKLVYDYVIKNHSNFEKLCIVGHSKGASVPIWTSTFFNEENIKNVAMGAVGIGGKKHSKFQYYDLYNWSEKTKRLTLMYGELEFDPQFWEYEHQKKYAETLLKNKRKMQSDKYIDFIEIQNADHDMIARPFFVEKWGLELIKACGFDNLTPSRSFSDIPQIGMIGMCKRNIIKDTQKCKKFNKNLEIYLSETE